MAVARRKNKMFEFFDELRMRKVFSGPGKHITSRSETAVSPHGIGKLSITTAYGMHSVTHLGTKGPGLNGKSVECGDAEYGVNFHMAEKR
jgi:hypothetical protein